MNLQRDQKAGLCCIEIHFGQTSSTARPEFVKRLPRFLNESVTNCGKLTVCQTVTMMLVQGFVPIIGEDALVVILGTLPSVDSLRLGQYYANPRNKFWYIVQQLFGIIGSYDERVRGLIKNRIVIWDVLSRAERGGSQDKKILKGTEAPNDFAAFFRAHSSIKTVFFNGGPAESYFRDLVVPSLQLGAGTPRLSSALASTSPAITHATPVEKVESWRIVQRTLANE